MDRFGGVRIIKIKTQPENGRQPEALDHHRPFYHFLGVCSSALRCAALQRSAAPGSRAGAGILSRARPGPGRDRGARVISGEND